MDEPPARTRPRIARTLGSLTRCLTPAEYFWLAEQVTGTDAATLAKIPRVELADSASHAPQASYDGEEFYPDIIDKAAVLTCLISGAWAGSAAMHFSHRRCRRLGTAAPQSQQVYCDFVTKAKLLRCHGAKAGRRLPLACDLTSQVLKLDRPSRSRRRACSDLDSRDRCPRCRAGPAFRCNRCCRCWYRFAGAE